MKNKLFTLAAVLTLAAVGGGFYAAPALADVIKAALVLSVDEPGRHPYVFTHESSGTDYLYASAPVPAGKRLVVQQISASSSTGVVFLVNFGVGTSTTARYATFPLVPEPFGNNTGGGPFTGYVDAGQNLIFLAEAPAGNTSSTVAVSGYLIDCNATTPCAAIAH